MGITYDEIQPINFGFFTWTTRHPLEPHTKAWKNEVGVYLLYDKLLCFVLRM